MSKDLNKVMITGRLGADPEGRYTPQGTPVTTFRVAAGRQWKDADGKVHEEAEWFRVVAWNRLAEVCNRYLVKGSRVYVEGRVQTRKWQDKDGQDRFTSEVIASDMIMLEGRKDTAPAETFDSEEDEAAAPPIVPSTHRATATPPARATNGQRSGGSRATTAPQRTMPHRGAVPEEDLPL